MAWVAVFEIVFTATGTALHGWPVSYLLWLTAALTGWIVLAFRLRVVPDRWLSLAAAAAGIVWVVTGFAVNAPGRPFSMTGEILNEATKTLLGLAYLVGGLRAR